MNGSPDTPQGRAKRAKENLTSARVKALKEPGYYWDAEIPGFCVRVSPTGAKRYLAFYRNAHGQQRWMQVGRHPVNTADQARAQAKIVLGEAGRGEDPAGEKKRAKKAVKVKDLVERFQEDHVARKKASTARAYNRQLDRFVIPALGSKPVSQVDHTDIATILNGLRTTPIMANRVLALLSVLFNHAERLGYRPLGSNPCRGQQRTREQSRERFLTDEELAKIGRVLDAAQTEALNQETNKGLVPVLVLRLLLLSGMRVSEALTLRWDQVNLDARLLRLDDTKTGRDLVDINPPMKAVLDLAWKHRVDGVPFVFPGRPKKDKEGKVSRGHWVNLRKPWLRMLKSAEVWTPSDEETAPSVQVANKANRPRPQDLRRTFGTVGFGDARLPHETIGKVLRHKQTSTTAIYAKLAGTRRREASHLIGKAMQEKLAPRPPQKRRSKPKK